MALSHSAATKAMASKAQEFVSLRKELGVTVPYGQIVAAHSVKTGTNFATMAPTILINAIRINGPTSFFISSHPLFSFSSFFNHKDKI